MTPLAQGQRYALRSGTAVLVLFALAGFLNADSQTRDPGYHDVGSYDSSPYSNVQDVFVYDKEGQLIQDAQIFDQNGARIQLGGGIYDGMCSDPTTGDAQNSRSMGYPYCPQNAPFVTPTQSAGPTPSSSVPTLDGASPSAVPGASAASASNDRLSPAPSGAAKSGSSVMPSVSASSGR